MIGSRAMARRPKPKYQVFISSTFSDLKREREAVTWEVLKANHIPVGMETFPAADDRGWKTIQRAIDRSDYYVLLVAGMYGTIDPETKISWTQREYEYARSKSVPVLAFIRSEETTTANLVEKDNEKRQLLAAFKETLTGAHLLETWREKEDLGGRVVHALRQQIEVDEEGENPRPGWYRGNEIPDGTTIEEFARLSSENADLRAKLSSITEAREKLVILRQNGSRVEDGTYEVPRFVIERSEVRKPDPYNLQDPFSRATMAAAVSLEDMGPSEEDLKEYLRDLSMVHWVRLCLKNEGGKPARNVVATFTVKDATGLVLNRLEKPEGFTPSFTGPRSPWYYDAGEHVYVSHEQDEPPVQVAQRIHLVGVGGAEKFVAMGFRGPGDGESPCSFKITVEYEVRSEDGATTSGTFTETVVVGGTKKVLKRADVVA